MIELFAYGQRPVTINDAVGKQYVLDIANSGTISLTYEVGRGDDTLGRYSPFSQTFRLPFTNANSEFLGHYYDINIQPKEVDSSEVAKFDVHKKCYCEIHVDGVPIIQGSLQLKNVHLKEEEYEVVVFGLEANLFQEISDKKLIDAFISGAGVVTTVFDVNMTDQIIVDSFDLSNDVTTGQIGAGIVIFPIIDYGHSEPYNFLVYQNDLTGQGSIANPGALQPYMLKPAIQLSFLFERVIKEAGYTLLETPFLSSVAWQKLYMNLGSDRETVATRGILGSQIANTGVTTLLTWVATGTSETLLKVIPFNDVTGSGTNDNPSSLYDPDGMWNLTTHKFVAPQSGVYYGQLHGKFDSSSILGDYGAMGALIVTGGEMGVVSGIYQDSGFSPLYGGNGTANIVTSVVCEWGGFLEEGEEFICYAKVNTGTGASGAVKLLSEGTYCTVQASTLVNGIASIPYNMPDILQTDFIKDLVQRFNLCIVSDSQNPNRLIVQPWQDYIDDGDTKDWTDRLDLSKKRKITPTDALRKKHIEMSDAEDGANINTWFFREHGYVIGRYKQEIGGDFVTGKMTNASIFAPFQVQNIPTLSNTNVSAAPDFMIAREYGIDTDGPISDAKPKLFYHNGLKTLDNTFSFFVGEVETTDYPLCLPFYNNGSPMDVDSPLLFWSFEAMSSFYNPTFGGTPSSQGYFARYWQQFLLSIYSEDARLFECSMVLSPSDIFNFKFNDEIRIENTPYRVLKISNYQPFADAPCKVQLLKRIETIPSLILPDPDLDCTLILTAYSQSGAAIFTDPLDGTTSSGTEVCCIENHLFWDGTDCMWNTGQGGGGGTTNPGGNPNLPSDSAKSFLTGVGGFNTVKTLRSLNFNPVSGEHSSSGINTTTRLFSSNKDFVYYATTYGAQAASGTANGDTSQNPSFDLPPNMMCRIVIRSLSIQKDMKGTTGSFGSTSFKVWTYVAKNLNGTITVTGSEQVDFAQDDADAGTRTVSVITSKGAPGFSPNDFLGVEISCTGSADRVITWHLDCSATYIDLSGSAIEEDLLLLENLGFILGQNNTYLEQE